MPKEQSYCEELQEKYDKLELILEKMLSGEKKVSKISGGPYHRGDDCWYRISDGQSNVLARYNKEDLVFRNDVPDHLEIGTEVIYTEGLITSVVPKELYTFREEEEFKLISWDSIGGFTSQIKRIREAVETPLNHSDIFKQMGSKPFCGLLLYGPPGCGKTLIAKAIASTVLKSTTVTKGAFVYVKGAELLSQYVGNTEQRIREIFKQARAYAKANKQRAVIFIDEAEALLNVRGARKSSDVDLTIVPTFLSEMSGFEDYNPFIVLATNLPDNLDPAVIRPGRIDLHIAINRPDAVDLKDIFRVHVQKTKTHDDVNDLISEGVSEFIKADLLDVASGSMVETIVNSACSVAINRKISDKKSKLGLTTDDIKVAISHLKQEHYAKAN